MNRNGRKSCHRSKAKRAWRSGGAAGKTHQQRSETRDGMRIDWDVPITMDDGLVLRADVFRPVAEGRYPVILSYGPYAKGLAFQDGYPSAWQRMAEKHPDVTAGSSNLYQSWEVVDPEKWVPHDYACVRVDSRGCRLLARRHRSFLAARDQGFLRLHRMGRRAAVVERQGRTQRHFLLRHQPMARGVAAAAASRRHVHLGRRRRLVSRHDPSRRHPLHVLGQLVRHAGQDRAIRRRRARQAKPRARRTGVRAGNAAGSRACQKPQRLRRRDSRPSARRRLSPRPLAGCGRRSRCRSCRRPIGAASRCIRAAISKVLSAPRPSRNGSKRTASSTGRISTPTTAATCNCASSIISCTARRTAGTSSRRCSCRCVTSIVSSSARRTNGRSSAPNGRGFISILPTACSPSKPAQEESGDAFRRHGRRRHLPHSAARP